MRVDAYPSSGSSPFHHYWVTVMEPLRLEHCDLGLDATLIGLAGMVRGHVRGLLQEASDERHRLPLLVRLYLADLDRSLGSLLLCKTLLIRWEYDDEARHSSV